MIPWFQYNVVYIGPIPIQVWGTFVALGMGLSLWIVYRYAKRYNLDANKLLDLGFWMIVFGVIFARVFHIAFYEPAFFLANPGDIIKVWHGGMSSFGGFFGALIPFYFFREKYGITKKNIKDIGDLVSFSALFGWIVGRIGCVMIHDHMGKPCDCFLAIQAPDGPRLEMALLEILGLLPLAILFIISWKKKKPAGWYTSWLLIYYGALRFILDFFRATDIAQADARYLGLTPAQYFAILLFIVGVRMFWKKKK